MSFSIQFADEASEHSARIKVIGVGGSGGNAINTMIHFGLEGVEFIVVNTDVQALGANAAPLKLAIGGAVTRGLGAGADPEKGRKAALEDATRIKELISGADMVFITAGMGGGTGTGAAPIIAQIAREEGALTVGVVTRPFDFEGKQRQRRAEQGIAMLSEQVDTLITVPNNKLLTLPDEDLSFVDAFRKADEVLYQAVKGISDLITQSGLVNVDFADVRAVMSNMGRALMGTGCAKGQGRARLAAEMAVSSPLLDDISVNGATGVLINIVGGTDLKMKEVQEAAQLVNEQAHEDANIILGATIDETLGDMVKVTVIATGFDCVTAQQQTPQSAQRAQTIPIQAMPQQPAPMSRNLYAQQPQSTMRPAAPAMREMAREAEAPASSYRRPPPTRDSQTAPAHSVRESMRSVMPELEADWDVPAFQRRNGMLAGSCLRVAREDVGITPHSKDPWTRLPRAAVFAARRDPRRSALTRSKRRENDDFGGVFGARRCERLGGLRTDQLPGSPGVGTITYETGTTINWTTTTTKFRTAAFDLLLTSNLQKAVGSTKLCVQAGNANSEPWPRWEISQYVWSVDSWSTTMAGAFRKAASDDIDDDVSTTVSSRQPDDLSTARRVLFAVA